MGDDSLKAVLAMAELPRFGRKTVNKILKTASCLPQSKNDVAELVQSVRQRLQRIPDISMDAIDSAYASAEAILGACEKAGISVHLVQGKTQDGWLATLAAIPDAPVLVYSRGNLASLSSPCMTIVGTRTPTAWGESTAQQVAKLCIEKGFSVVSGLALGCDAAAHRGALTSHGSTIAVLAHGLDAVHPKVHTELAEQMIISGGCLLSEYPPGVSPRRSAFVDRDRLQSALGAGLIVIETTERGGTNHTVAFAREQGRLVGCAVHPEKFESHENVLGNQRILSEGAFPITDSSTQVKYMDTCMVSKARTLGGDLDLEDSADGQPNQGSLF